MTTYLMLFLGAFLAASLVPLASEPLLIAVVLRSGQVLLPITVASAGNYLGAVSTYLVAGGLADRFARRWRPTAGPAAAGWMRRYGAPALLFSWIPIIGDGIVAAAGIARVPFWVFTGWVLPGKVARYVAVTWVMTRFI